MSGRNVCRESVQPGSVLMAAFGFVGHDAGRSATQLVLRVVCSQRHCRINLNTIGLAKPEGEQAALALVARIVRHV